MSEIAISLKNVSKCYKRYSHPVDRLKEILRPGKSKADEFWALREINLEVFKGETLGIIGQNGSGKSTLLQIIAGTLTPTTGEVQVNGRISALLELGSGFNPEFTGQQNVFFNGQILGLSREEIEAKFDDIAAFAEIGDFINQPVKTYSSGMLVRLAFAVLANTEPKILIVDEALAVGDVRFQSRCMKRIRQLKEQGVTILFVSHDSSSIKMLCQRAALISHGRMLETGVPKEVVNHYIALLSSDQEQIDIEPIVDTDNHEQLASEPEHKLVTINQNIQVEHIEINIEPIIDTDNHEQLASEPEHELVTTNQNIQVEHTEINIESIVEKSDHHDLLTSEQDHELVTINQNTQIEHTEIKIKSTNSDKSDNHEHLILNQDHSFATPDQNIQAHRHGNKLAVIKNAQLKTLNDKKVENIETGSIFRIEVLLEASVGIYDLVVGISIRNLMGLVIYGTNTKLLDAAIPYLTTGQQISVIFQLPCYFNKGVYTLTVGIHSEEGLSYDWIDDMVVFEVNNSNKCDGFVDLNSSVEVKQAYHLIS